MRVRFGVGLPGPFYVSGSTRRRKGQFPIFTLFVVIALVIVGVQAHPWVAFGVFVGIAVLIAWFRATRNRPANPSEDERQGDTWSPRV